MKLPVSSDCLGLWSGHHFCLLCDCLSGWLFDLVSSSHEISVFKLARVAFVACN